MKKKGFNYSMCLFVCEYVSMSQGSYGDQKRVWDSLELDVQVLVSHTIWVLLHNNKKSG